MLKIKIPNNIKIFYNNQQNFLIFKNNKTELKLLKLKIKIIIDSKKKVLIITSSSIIKIANNQKKQLVSIQGLVASQIKQILIELTIKKYYQKLKFVGIGYRAIKINNKNEKNIFLLKLGLSHPLYLCTTNLNTNIVCLKFTKLFISGNSYSILSQLTANIKLTKWPEPYKGKGIIFNDEKIKLKEGKKI